MKGLPQSHYFSCKGNMPLIRAVEKAFAKLPDEFSGYQLYRATVKLYFNPNVFPDTVLRRLRELKGSGLIDYLCIDQIESKYKKI